MKNFLCVFLGMVYTLVSGQETLNRMNQHFEMNAIRFTVDSRMNFFQNTQTDRGTFEVPAGSGIISIFSSAPWFTADRNGGDQRSASNTFLQSGSDFTEGTMEVGGCEYLPSLLTFTRREIENHQRGYDLPGYQVPLSFSNYPATDLSGIVPFVDENHDGIYNPEKGDYPDLPGDFQVVLVNNDNVLHTASAGEPLFIDLFTVLYAYESDDSKTLAETLFVKYLVKNNAPNKYTDFRLAQWIDFDLGNYNDDYIGTNVEENMVYVYNGDPEDDINGGAGTKGYGTNPPACGFVLLSEELYGSISFNIGTAVDGDPNNVHDYYNYSRGKYKNGESFVHPENQTPYRYIYPGDTDPNNKGFQTPPSTPVAAWTEESAGNQPGDRRIVGYTAGSDFLSGELKCYTAAFVWARAESADVSVDPFSIKALQKRASEISAFYNAKDQPCN